MHRYQSGGQDGVLSKLVLTVVVCLAHSLPPCPQRAEDLAESVEPDSELLEEIAEEPKGMHDTDLRSMKDALLIETSEMLGVSGHSCDGVY